MCILSILKTTIRWKWELSDRKFIISQISLDCLVTIFVKILQWNSVYIFINATNIITIDYSTNLSKKQFQWQLISIPNNCQIFMVSLHGITSGKHFILGEISAHVKCS